MKNSKLSTQVETNVIDECKRHGYSFSVLLSDQAYYYNRELMEYYTEEEVRAEYEENAEYLEEEEDIHSFAESLDYLTAMGGPLMEVSDFYAFRADGVLHYHNGDDCIDWTIQAAEDFCKFEEEEGRQPVIEIVKIVTR